MYIENSPINILDFGGINRLASLGEKYEHVAGASFAAANVTAIIVDKIKENLEFEKVINYRSNCSLFTTEN